MSEMIERLALVIATKKHTDAVKFNLGQIDQGDKLHEYLALYPVKVRDEDRELARLLIEAMREPTEAMLDQGPPEPYMDAWTWGKMIDAALTLPAHKA